MNLAAWEINTLNPEPCKPPSPVDHPKPKGLKAYCTAFTPQTLIEPQAVRALCTSSFLSRGRAARLEKRGMSSANRHTRLVANQNTNLNFILPIQVQVDSCGQECDVNFMERSSPKCSLPQAANSWLSENCRMKTTQFPGTRMWHGKQLRRDWHQVCREPNKC